MSIIVLVGLLFAGFFSVVVIFGIGAAIALGLFLVMKWWLRRTDRIFETENPAIAALDDDQTWQRMPNGQDTDTSIDWRFRGASRGASNN